MGKAAIAMSQREDGKKNMKALIDDKEAKFHALAFVLHNWSSRYTTYEINVNQLSLFQAMTHVSLRLGWEANSSSMDNYSIEPILKATLQYYFVF